MPELAVLDYIAETILTLITLISIMLRACKNAMMFLYSFSDTYIGLHNIYYTMKRLTKTNQDSLCLVVT